MAQIKIQTVRISWAKFPPKSCILIFNEERTIQQVVTLEKDEKMDHVYSKALGDREKVYYRANLVNSSDANVHSLYGRGSIKLFNKLEGDDEPMW